MRNVFILTMAGMLFTSAVNGKTLVVNPAWPSASDTNPGTQTQPLRTISRAAELAQPGDVVQIHAGVYREKVVINQSGTQEKPLLFTAAPQEKVIITGADPLTNWTKEGPIYSAPWPHRLFQGDDHNPGGSEQVFVNRKILRKVAGLKELMNDTFCVDLAGKRMYLSVPEDPSEQTVEASTRTQLWVVNGSNIQTRGLIFRYAANRAQQGMGVFKGAFALVENCTFEWANSTGASLTGQDMTVRDCVFQDNGQQGYSGSGAHRLHLDGCTVQRNNMKEYPRGWEAGGNKICMSRGVVYENCRFLNNYGSGIWFDIGNEDITIRNCLIADNEDAGIFYEISYGLHAYDNVIVGNGCRPSKGAWGANGGVCISSSPGCVIERNLILNNYQGFCFREQNRTTPRIGARRPEVPVWNHDTVVRNNLIANNQKGQVQGWFDIADERHWPKHMQSGKTEAGKAKEDVAAGYQAATSGVPAGLTLEDLKLTFQENCYALEPGQPFFIWGTNWKRKQQFKDVASLTAALGFEGPKSANISPLVVNIQKRDFRLPKNHPALAAGAYPKGTVPECTLGTH